MLTLQKQTIFFHSFGKAEQSVVVLLFSARGPGKRKGDKTWNQNIIASYLTLQ